MDCRTRPCYFCSGGSRWSIGRHHSFREWNWMAGGAHPLVRTSSSLRALLVRIRRGHQDYGRCGNLFRLAKSSLIDRSRKSIIPNSKDLMSISVSDLTREITVAHSPDSDDAFMFYGLATNKVRVPGLRFTHTLCDIETLNQKAMEGVYDVTAISFHAYPYIQDHYALLPSGGSVGDGYGPMIVAQRAYSVSDIKRKRIAVPGTLTTAYLVLKLFAP